MTTVLEQMTGKPGRKCRGESLLRLLLSTSYPQTILSDLTFAFTRHSGTTDEESLEKLAILMRNTEKDFDMFDFIRCIEIKRDGDTITIVIKRLDFDPTMRALNDSVNTHEHMASTTVVLSSADDRLEDIEQLAIKLLEVFYRSQVKVKRNTDISGTTWKCRQRETDRRKTKTEQTAIDFSLDFEGVVETIATSLRKRRFQLILTQNAFLLPDQRKRIWGVSKA